MLRNEDIKKIDELKTDFTHRWSEADYISKVIDIFKFSSLLKSFSHFKKQGYKFKEVLSTLLVPPFMGIANVNLMRDKNFKAKKDVFYRFKKSLMAFQKKNQKNSPAKKGGKMWHRTKGRKKPTKQK